jgi:hypothetical protein
MRIDRKSIGPEVRRNAIHENAPLIRPGEAGAGSTRPSFVMSHLIAPIEKLL